MDRVSAIKIYYYTRSATIMERVDADPFLSFKFYLKRQILESYKNACTIVNCHVNDL